MQPTTGIRMLACLGALLATEGVARANGMSYMRRDVLAADGSGQVAKAVPTDQRAALVRDGTSWSLVLEPRYDRPEAGAAWLVPFAHCPTVAPADFSVLGELGLATAPLFLSVCLQTCDCSEHTAHCLPEMGFGGGDSGGKDLGTEDGGDTLAGTDGQKPLHVDVWQTGTIGNLDFVVISADNPADIPEWLDRGGYDSPPELAEFVTAYAGDYGCYFAARIGVPEGGSNAYPAVRFVLDPRDPPTYPLRLTQLGVAEGQTLGLTLYVVNPADRYEDGASTVVAPANFQAQALECAGKTAEAVQACLDQALAAKPSTMAVTFHGSLASRDHAFLKGYLCNFESWDSVYGYHDWHDSSDTGWCLKSSKVFDGIPTTWTDEVRGWLAGGARVTRYEGRLPASALDHDLVFQVAPGVPAESCASRFDCRRSTDWKWDGEFCLPSGSGGACARWCYDATDCPTGWTCDSLYAAAGCPDGRLCQDSGYGFNDSGYYANSQRVCRAPVAGEAAPMQEFQDPLARTDALYVTYTQGCGYDCDDVCYHNGSTASAATFGSPGRPATDWGHLPLFAVLVFGQLLLIGMRRRR